MIARLLLRLLAPLFAVALILAGVLAIGPHTWHLILIAAFVATGLAIVAGFLWQRHIVRDEATPPKVSGPEPSASVTRSLDRPVVPGRVLARRDERPRRKVQA